MNKKLATIALLCSMCSLIYELLYAQVLTVTYGGQVLRYSLTIGLFLLSKGIGSFLSSRFKKQISAGHFIFLEFLLTIIGPLGVFTIFWVGKASLMVHYYYITLFIAHLPIILIGILTGMEIPFLERLQEKGKNTISLLLAWDYVGALLGAVGFAIWLYPKLGLVSTALIAGGINLLATTIMLMGSRVSRRPLILTGIVALAAVFSILVINIKAVHHHIVDQFYAKALERTMKSNVTQDNSNAQVQIHNSLRTRYQKIIEFSDPYGKCVSIDFIPQICKTDSQAYHVSQIDVPMAFLKEGPKKKVLLIGSGDGAALSYISKYNVSVTHVDIDKEFVEYSKRSKFLKQFIRGKRKPKDYKYLPKDGFTYLRLTEKTFDLIVIGLPGLTEDKLQHLYSVEFFTLLKRAMKPRALAVSWIYRDDHRSDKHYDILASTLYKAGFKKRLVYESFVSKNTNADAFMIISKKKLDLKTNPLPKTLPYHQLLYQTMHYENLTQYTNTRPNSLFKPNNQIIVPRYSWP